MRHQLDRSQRELLEESSDLHRDAMRSTNQTLDELIGRHSEVAVADEDPTSGQRRAAQLQAVGTLPASSSAATADTADREFSFSQGAGVAGVLAAGMVALSASTAYASSNTDIAILQTQASIENLAVATYSVALTLPFIGGSSAIPLVKFFVNQTKTQHAEHAQTFNAALRRLKGKVQTQPDPVLLKIVNKAKPTLTSPGAVVALALALEDGAAATYVKNAATITDPSSRALTASIMGVEAQHVAVLLAVQALVRGNATQLITLPPPVAKLPSAAGNIGFPQPFYSTANARPANEGAVN